MKINSITQCLKPGVDCSLYVDDFQICYRSSSISIIERQLQLCLNKRPQCAADNGFWFSKIKTVYAYLPEKRSPFRSTAFSWQKSNSSSVGYQISEDYIWQEVILCTRLKYVKKKGLKHCNILNVIGNTECGADWKVMLCLYRSLVKSKLDYGYIVYGSTRKSYLQMLDLVHNQGLRICFRTFRTSPVESLHILY